MVGGRLSLAHPSLPSSMRMDQSHQWCTPVGCQIQHTRTYTRHTHARTHAHTHTRHSCMVRTQTQQHTSGRGEERPLKSVSYSCPRLRDAQTSIGTSFHFVFHHWPWVHYTTPRYTSLHKAPPQTARGMGAGRRAHAWLACHGRMPWGKWEKRKEGSGRRGGGRKGTVPHNTQRTWIRQSGLAKHIGKYGKRVRGYKRAH